MNNRLQEEPVLRARGCKSSPGSHQSYSMSTGDYWVAALTFLAGFGVMAVLSLKARTFNILRPTVNFPLTALPSVVLGDSVLLPMFNVRLFRFARGYVARHVVGRYPLYSGSALLVLSLLGNMYLHKMWITNQSTVFTRAESGGLSSTGWWHFGFSTVETWLVLLFLCAWCKCFQKNDHLLVALGLRTWVVLMYFSLLSLADFVLHDFYVHRLHSLSQALRADYLFLLFPTVCVLTMYAAARAYRALSLD